MRSVLDEVGLEPAQTGDTDWDEELTDAGLRSFHPQAVALLDRAINNDLAKEACASLNPRELGIFFKWVPKTWPQHLQKSVADLLSGGAARCSRTELP